MSEHQGINHKWMGHSNKLIVFNLIRLEGPITRTKLAKLSGLSKAAISSSVNKLLERNLITESKHERYEKVGRKPHLLSVNPSAAYFISIDIGFNEIRFSLTNLSDQLVSKNKTKTPTKSWEEVLNTLLKNIKGLSKWSNIEYQKATGVSIGLPGVVDSNGIVSYVPKIGDKKEYPLKEKLSRELEIPLLLENNVNLSTLGEFSRQYGDYENLVYLSFHEGGIGAGIVINGNLYKGADFHAGEVGWLVTDKSCLEKCQKENQGFLESQVSSSALVKKGKKLLKKRNSHDPLLDRINDIEDLNVKKIFNSYRTSSVANQLIQEWVKDIATTLVAISSMLDPDLIILGGRIVEFARPTLKELIKIVDRHTQRTPKIEVSDNYPENTLYGGAQLCFENLNSIIWHEENFKDEVRG